MANRFQDAASGRSSANGSGAGWAYGSGFTQDPRNGRGRDFSFGFGFGPFGSGFSGLGNSTRPGSN
ncbi:hypothetical protein DsansV1_C06g0064791 [Dioscorea sansibarensis]